MENQTLSTYKHFFFLILLLGVSMKSTQAQLLYPESYVVIFDSTKNFKGSIAPSIELITQKELYLEINNTADLIYKFKHNAIVLANNFELTRSGEETILSGGFVYAKYKKFFDNPLVMEHYMQYQWAEARGLQHKYAIGSNIRYKLYKNSRGGVFAGIGPFYEYENWSYIGVPDDRLPANQESVIQKQWKLNFYVSSKRFVTEKLKLETAYYFQNTFTHLFEGPRHGGSVGLSYSITEHIGFGVQYRMSYDFDPVVPVDKYWYNTFTQLEIIF